MNSKERPDSVRILKSPKRGKKYAAIFSYNNSNRTKTIHFGAEGMSDFTKHKTPERKARYINRHKKRENWNVPDTAGSLSRWILWNKPSFQDSVSDYKRKFRLR